MPKRRALRKPLKLTEFYCVGCSRRVEQHASEIRLTKDVNGRPRLSSSCDYGHKMFKYISPDDKEDIRDELKELRRM